jgi:hypothetical protein
MFNTIADADGNTLSMDSAADTLVFSAPGRGGSPVLAPDGHQLTLGEFTKVKGLGTVNCRGNGTELVINLTGLVPGGTYTLWNVVFADPGFDGTMDNRVGLGAFGSTDGSDNFLTASSSGRGTLTVTVPPGPMSLTAPNNDGPHELGSCLTGEEFEFHVVGSYKTAGKTYGPTFGPAEENVFHFGFTFIN